MSTRPAAANEAYGATEVVHISTVTKPEVQAGEVLARVHAGAHTSRLVDDARGSPEIEATLPLAEDSAHLLEPRDQRQSHLVLDLAA